MKFLIAALAIVAIFLLEKEAIRHGKNGICFAASTSGITLVVGYVLGGKEKKQ